MKILGLVLLLSGFAQEKLDLIPSREFYAKHRWIWQSVLNETFHWEKELVDIEKGIVKTRWVDVTDKMRFLNGDDDLAARQVKLTIHVLFSIRKKRPLGKITIFRQERFQDEPGGAWKKIVGDEVMEKTLFYRIERSLLMKIYLSKNKKYR